MRNIIILIILISIIFMIHTSNKIIEAFDNIPENIGNHLCEYFYKYVLSICNQSDFLYTNESSSNIIRYLPTYIKFNLDLYQKLQNANITSDLVHTECSNCIWYCHKQWIFDMWKILRSTIHYILDDALKKSNLFVESNHPIIHFRCADTPFVKHIQYFLQRYHFFKTALDKCQSDHIILMSNSSHLSLNKEQDACLKYTNMLQKYIQSIGYECNIQSKTNVEDFADLFYAPYVISTGSSFSFMAGFFGIGAFLSTEHCFENEECNVNDDIFIKGYNIRHSKIDSYYDIDNVEMFLRHSF